MALPELLPLEQAKYRWETSKSNPRTLQRRGNGTENWVGFQKENTKGQYDLHTIVALSVLEPISLSTLEKRLQAALNSVRFQHPSIACDAVWDEQFGPLIQYTPPIDDQEALAWARDTIYVRLTAQTALDMRREIVAGRHEKEEPSRSVTIYLIANAIDKDTPLALDTTIEILFHMNHIYWDGISARHFVGELLRGVGQDLTLTRYEWGKEVSNLAVPILDGLKVDLGSLGDDYKTSVDEYLSTLFRLGSSWSLPIEPDPGLPETAFLRFTPSESQRVNQAIKSRLGKEYTMSHLGQAATLLALLKTNPPPPDVPEDQTVTMLLPVNGRRYLKDDLANQYGCCQTGAAVDFKGLRAYNIDDKPAVVRSLVKGARFTKQSYDYWLSKSFLLVLGVAKDNFFASYLASVEGKPSTKTVPIFVSDGVVDKYVPGTVTSVDGAPLLSVDNVTLFTDSHDPGVLVRMESWKGATSLSLSYCTGGFSPQQADAFLHLVRNFMLYFVDDSI